MNWDHDCPSRHEGLSLGVNFSISQAAHESRATLNPLLESSQINSSMDLHGHKSHHLICQQPRSRSRDVENSDPSLAGRGTEVAKRKPRRRGSASKHAIANHKKGRHAPSFIGEIAVIHWIWSQPATFLAVFTELSKMQKTFVSVKLSSLVLPYMCCRRQCSVQRVGSQGIQTTELFRFRMS